jgi:hypothetical protein
MVFSDHSSSGCPTSNDIKSFLNGCKISELLDFVSIRQDTIAYVIGCFYGVSQGIDFMIEEHNNMTPRLLVDFMTLLICCVCIIFLTHLYV